MSLFGGWKKKGRPRSKFTLEESKTIIEDIMGEHPHLEVKWDSHKQLHPAVFSVDVGFISFSVVENFLKHRHVRDLYFGPKRGDTGKMTIKLFYR